MQGEFGYPSIFRLSDQEETDVAMRTYHVHGTPADTLLRWLGYQPMQRCLLLATADGDADFTRLVDKKVKQICKRYHAFTLTPFRVTQAWEKSRFTDPFMREDLMDYGITSDILFVPESGGKQAMIKMTEIALGVGTAAAIFRMGR